MAATATVDVVTSLDRGTVAAVTALCSAAAEADGVSPLSEHVTLHLRYGGEGRDRHLLARDADGALAGYGHLDPTDAVAGASAEIVVDPARRRHGVGRLLVEAALEQTRSTAPDGRLRLWAHGDHPAARALAASLGFEQTRSLLQLRRSLLAPLPTTTLPVGVRLRAFRPGHDDEEWLALNASAFAAHPEQGGWTPQDLQARIAESWFDASGFLVAEDEGPDGTRMVGFHWTKVHGEDPAHAHRSGEHEDRHDGLHGPDGGTAPHGHEPIGEVYVVGVAPWAQGRGLGKALTVAGLRWLRSRGLSQAMLYVEGDNAAALATYTTLGFTRWDTDVVFSRRSAAPR